MILLRFKTLAGIILFGANFFTICESFIPTVQEYVYEYYSAVSTSADLKYDSSWTMFAQLHVQGRDGYAIFQLKDPMMTVFFGDSRTEKNLTKFPLPSGSEALLKPFIVNYKGSLAKNLAVETTDPQWSVNIKRSIGSLFQLDVPSLPSMAFTTNEENIYGVCPVDYIVQKSNSSLVVTKHIETEKCKGEVTWKWSNTKPLICSSQQTSDISNSVRTYWIDQTNENLFVGKIESVGIVSVQPFINHGKFQMSRSSQSLNHISTLDIKEDIILADKIDVNLSFEVPDGDVYHVTQTSDSKSQERLIKQIEEEFINISEDIEKSPLHKSTYELHREAIQNVVYNLQLLEEPSFQVLYQKIATGTSYQQETLRNLFIEMLPQVGTKVSTKFIRELVKNKKFNEYEAMWLVSVFPFYVHDFWDEILDENWELISLGDDIWPSVKRAAILSFSHLLNKVCVAVSCQPDKVEYYVRYFLNLFTESKTYEEQLLYLDALQNIEIGNVFNYLEPIVRGNVSNLVEESHHIRFLAVWASFSQAPYHPNEVFKLYWPILLDQTEHLEMRVAALVMLMVSGDFNRAKQLHWHMTKEPNIHLRNFYYTTIHSIEKTTFPCYNLIKKTAEKIIPFIPKFSPSTVVTENQVMDYTSSDNKIGGILQRFIIANEKTGNPNVLYSMVDRYAMGYSIGKLAIYLKLQGLEDTKRSLIFSSKPVLNYSELIKLLKKLNINAAQAEPIHIELKVLLDDKIIISEYMNDTTLRMQMNKLHSVVAKMGHNFHINYQRFLVPWTYEKYQPTDVGTLLCTHWSTTSSLSIRANNIKKNYQIDFWSSYRTNAYLIADNPMLNIWHSAENSQVNQIYVPLNLQLNMNPSNLNLKINLNPDNRLGAISHAQSTGFIRGHDADGNLATNCPDCPRLRDLKSLKSESIPIYVLRFPVLGTNLVFSLYGCDDPSDLWEAESKISDLIDSITTNTGLSELAEPLLIAYAVKDYLNFIPLAENCGIKVELESIDKLNSEVHADFQITSRKDKKRDKKEYLVRANINYVHQNETQPVNSLALLIACNYEKLQKQSNYYMKMIATQTLKNENEDKLCMEGQVVVPKVNNFLSITPPKNESDRGLNGEIAVLWGLSEDVGAKGCPKNGTEIRISVRGDISEDQIQLIEDNVSPFKECKDTRDPELWGSDQTPVTEACFDAFSELGILRKYNVSVNYKGVAESVLTSAAKDLKSYIPVSNNIKGDKSSFTASVEVGAGDSEEIHLTLNDWQYTLDDSRDLVEPFLFNVHVPFIMQLQHELRLTGTCLLNSRYVRTFDNETVIIPANQTKCYSLLTADCSKEPRFAVLYQQTLSSKRLAVKFYVGNKHLQLVPVGKKNIKAEFMPNDLEEFDIKEEEKVIKVTSASSEVTLVYNGYFVLVTAPVIYRGSLCGLCGDYNSNPSNEHFGDIHRLPC